MLNSPVLETIISLTFIILVFAILVTCVQEGYVSLTKSRGKMLEKAISDVLNDNFNKNFAYLLYQHPQIDLLKKKQGDLPSYIDGETFARTLIDLVAKESTEVIYEESADKKTMLKRERFIQPVLEKSGMLAGKESTPVIKADTDPGSVFLSERFRLGVESLQFSDLKKLMLSFLSNTTKKGGEENIEELKTQIENLSNTIKKGGEENIEELKTQIQNWYNSYMDRVTGWYKRKVKKNIFVVSAIVTLFFNLNFFTLSKTIYADTKLRNTLVSMADSVSKEQNPITALQNKLKNDSTVLGEIDPDVLLGVELPIGWKISVNDAGTERKTWVGKAFRFIGYFFENHFTVKNIIGWLIFIMALSLGAPFWFDVMRKLVNVRNAGISPQQKAGK